MRENDVLSEKAFGQKVNMLKLFKKRDHLCAKYFLAFQRHLFPKIIMDSKESLSKEKITLSKSMNKNAKLAHMRLNIFIPSFNKCYFFGKFFKNDISFEANF